MKQQYFEFIQSPGLETYLAIRQLVLSHPSFNPYSSDLSDLFALLEAGEYIQVQEGFSRVMPNLLLSPRAHLIAAVAAENTGYEHVADVERHIAKVCTQGILSTGDGSAQSPYLVLRPSDESDVLNHLGEQPLQQSRKEVGGKHFDVIITTQDREIWFDISEAHGRLQSTLEEPH